MNARQYQFHDGKMGSAITVRLTPRSSRNQISDILNDGTVRVRITAPPTEGQANEALIKFLAHVLDIAASKIEIVGGHTGRDKLVAISDLDASTVQQRILQHLDG